jgi:hypothetical protein
MCTTLSKPSNKLPGTLPRLPTPLARAYKCPAYKTEKPQRREKPARTVQTTSLPLDEAAFNKGVNELQQLMYEDNQEAIRTYLASLTATELPITPCGKLLIVSNRRNQPFPLCRLSEENGRKVICKKSIY